MKSRTLHALEWLKANPASNPYQAAMRHGITPSCLYASIKRREARKVCSCCGQTIKGDKK